jgi:putative addiction module killer protein
MVHQPERDRGGKGDGRAMRLGSGNFSNVEGLGAGVYEYKIDFGPGYRIYFGEDGQRIVILLGGSAKTRQGVAGAQAAWTAYKRAKAGKGGETWH